MINRNCKHSFLLNHNHIPRSTLSLPKAPIYARIVKTPKVTNTIEHRTSTPKSFIKPMKNDDRTNVLTINRLKHASDSDLFNRKKSIKL